MLYIMSSNRGYLVLKSQRAGKRAGNRTRRCRKASDLRDREVFDSDICNTSVHKWRRDATWIREWAANRERSCRDVHVALGQLDENVI